MPLQLILLSLLKLSLHYSIFYTEVFILLKNTIFGGAKLNISLETNKILNVAKWHCGKVAIKREQSSLVLCRA